MSTAGEPGTAFTKRMTTLAGSTVATSVKAFSWTPVGRRVAAATVWWPPAVTTTWMSATPGTAVAQLFAAKGTSRTV